MTTRKLRYRVANATFSLAAPMYIEIECGYLENPEDVGSFVRIQVIGHTLTPEQTGALLLSPPDPAAQTRQADLQAAMQTILQQAGIIAGDLAA